VVILVFCATFLAMMLGCIGYLIFRFRNMDGRSTGLIFQFGISSWLGFKTFNLMEKNKVELALDTIIASIYEIRGQKVMLDKDLALLYGVTTGNLNKAVNRNLQRFPPDFMFELSNEEWEQLKPLESRWNGEAPANRQKSSPSKGWLCYRGY
jgi:hypothetical protein